MVLLIGAFYLEVLIGMFSLWSDCLRFLRASLDLPFIVTNTKTLKQLQRNPTKVKELSLFGTVFIWVVENSVHNIVKSTSYKILISFIYG